MPQSVDHTGGKKGYPEHLHRPYRGAKKSKQHKLRCKQNHNSRRRAGAVNLALNKIVRQTVVAVSFHGLFPGGLVAVQLSPVVQHRIDAAGGGAVRILIGLDLGVVLAVDRDPLAGDEPGCQPQPEPHRMRNKRVQLQAAVRLAAMQVNGHTNDRDVRQPESQQDIPQPRELKQALAGNDVKKHRAMLIQTGVAVKHRTSPAGNTPCGGDGQ